MLDCRINYKHDALKNDGQTLHLKRYDKKGIELSKKSSLCPSKKIGISTSFSYLQHSASDNYMMIIQSWLFYK